jgi:hypothetical protein
LLVGALKCIGFVPLSKINVRTAAAIATISNPSAVRAVHTVRPTSRVDRRVAGTDLCALNERGVGPRRT